MEFDIPSDFESISSLLVLVEERVWVVSKKLCLTNLLELVWKLGQQKKVGLAGNWRASSFVRGAPDFGLMQIYVESLHRRHLKRNYRLQRMKKTIELKAGNIARIRSPTDRHLTALIKPRCKVSR